MKHKLSNKKSLYSKEFTELFGSIKDESFNISKQTQDETYLSNKEELIQRKTIARAVSTYNFRKQKSKNFFLRFFYLGKTKSPSKLNTNENFYIKKNLFDSIRFRKFIKWQRKMECTGVEIKRNYFYKEDNETFGSEHYPIYNQKSFFFSYKQRICDYDYYDIFTNLIVNLTVKGIYFGLWGHSVESKDQMQKCWTIRKELIKAFNYEEWLNINKVNKSVLENDQRLQTKKAFDMLAENIYSLWD